MKLRCLSLTPILLLLPFGQAHGETAVAEDHFADEERVTKIIRRWEESGRSAAKPKARSNADNSGNAKQQRKHALALLDTAAAYVDAGMLSGDDDKETSFAAARHILDPFLATIPEGLEVTSEGGANLDNLRLSEAAWAHALRYRIAGEPADLQRASQLLLEFADKMQAWPVLLHNTGNRWVPQSTQRLPKSYSSGGFWGRWYPLDMMECYPLLRTYRIVAPTLSAEERKKIIEGVFDLQVALVDRWEEGYHNTLVYKIDGLIHFGFALGRPDYIHRAIGLLRTLSSKGFSPDGFWHEGTPAYHQQVNIRLQSSVRLLDGYSDRAGAAASASGQRSDPLQLQKEFALHNERTTEALRKLTLPNGSVVAVNDADPENRYGEPKNASTPELLGTSGFAVLGSGKGDEQQQLFLNFKGTYGHEHLDVNGIHWFALGRRWFDETRYRPLPGSGSSRKWSSSTAAHNTVVIDEKSQDNRFAQGRLPRSGDMMASHYATNHMGDLLLFDGRQSAVQVIEVEGKKAYPSVTQRYRRTLIKVDLGKGEGYVVDIFRVQGGALHDYMLHGALAEPYTVTTSTPLQPTTGQLHQYIELTGKAAPELPFEWTFSYQDGASSRSIVLAPAATTLLLGEAPAINRLGKAPFVDLRHEAKESTFVVIHEARKGAPRIDQARLLTPPGEDSVAVEIQIGDRLDTILSTLSPDATLAVLPSRPDAGEVRMEGRLGYFRREAGQVTDATLWDGTRLSLAGELLCHSPQASYEAQVSKTQSREAGDPVNAVVLDKLLPEHELVPGATLHIDLGGELTWSYRIAHVEQAGGKAIVHLDHDPGFIVKEKSLELTFHPSWSISGTARARIPVVSSHKAPEKQEHL